MYLHDGDPFINTHTGEVTYLQLNDPRRLHVEWTESNGRLVKKSDYPELYTIIGDNYGSGTEREFHIPDFRALITNVELNETTAKEMVDHPDHYGGEDNPYEVIKIIEHFKLGFNLGNTVKYILRAGRKNSAKLIEDLKKARWYLDREIQNLEKNDEHSV